MLAWIKFGKGETPESAGMKGDKFVGKYYVKFDQIYREEVRQLMADGILKEDAEKEASIMKEAQELLKKWEDKDTEAYSLWEKMNHWVYDGFEKTYKTMGVEFDRLYYESETYLEGKNEVLKGVESGNFTRKEDGSVWVDLTDEGLDEKLLLRKDGTSVYITQDIGTAMMRFRDYPGLSRIIYTVGNEQDYHFKVLFLILKKLGVEWYKGLYHLSYGMVDLPTGRMKSREGTVVDADDLMEEMIITAEKHTRELGKIEGFEEEQAKDLYRILGLGALKYFLLRIDPRKRMQFDPEESIEFQGNTGPFIQYTHARIASILRKAAELNFDPRGSFSMTEINRYERDVLFLINDFENRIDEAAKELSPSLIAQYVYEIAKEYNKFYSEISIFNEKDPEKIKARVKLSYITSRTIKAAMLLLGIEVPDRM
jgi:arginyl-tRNA synthetase